MLSHLGCVTVPEETLEKKSKGKWLTKDERLLFTAHPQIGHDLISKIPRLENVAEVILYQEKGFNGSGFPDDERAGEEIPIGARVLKLALDFDTLFLSGEGTTKVLREIFDRKGQYDPVIVEALRKVIEDQLSINYESKIVSVGELTPNMTLAEDVISDSGALVIAKGQDVTQAMCIRLKNFAITTSIRVLIPVKASAPGNKGGEDKAL